MATLSVTVLLLLLSSGFSLAQTPQTKVDSLFHQGNEKLQSGYYQQALSYYQLIEQRRTFSGPLFLNMGIAYARLDSLGMAKYYLLKARKYPATHRPANEALRYVNSRFSHQSAVLPKLPWERAVNWLLDHWGSVGIFSIGFVLLMLTVGGYLYTWFASRFRKPVQIASRITAGIGILAILLSVYINYVDRRYSKAVMVSQQIPVRKNPAASAPTVDQAYEGFTFTVDSHRSRNHEPWLYVRLPNGKYGWIKQRHIKIL